MTGDPTRGIVRVVPDPASLAESAAEAFVRLTSAAIAVRGRFTVALSGGHTPRALYELLATSRFASRIDWSRVYVFWGDERCVPPDDPQSNYRMAREMLLDRVPLPADNIYRMKGELEPNQAAADYDLLLREFWGNRLGVFDLVLLGLGENGHTASLFPGMPAVHEQVRWVLAQYVREVQTWRLTLTPVVINAAANVLFLVEGTSKANVLRQVLQGPYQPDRLPAQIVRPTHGKPTWLVDVAAAAELEKSI